MDNSTTRRPREVVFATYELGENILSHLPSMFDLVKGQQVCRHFNTTTKCSKILRQKLFLEHEPRELESDGVLETQLHPSLQRGFLLPSPNRNNGFKFRCRLENLEFKRMLCWQPGDWEGMLLCKPPIEELVMRGVKGQRWLSSKMTAEDSDGIRLGALVKGIKEWEENCDSERRPAELWDMKELMGLLELIEIE